MIENKLRLRRECKLNVNSKNFKCVYGTTNRLNPSVIYLKLNSWVKYDGDVKDYDLKINSLNYAVKNKIKKIIVENERFTSNYFYTPSIKKTINNNNNMFHICFEFTLKQKDLLELNINNLKMDLEDMSNSLIDVIEQENGFSYTIKK